MTAWTGATSQVRLEERVDRGEWGVRERESRREREREATQF